MKINDSVGFEAGNSMRRHDQQVDPDLGTVMKGGWPAANLEYLKQHDSPYRYGSRSIYKTLRQHV